MPLALTVARGSGLLCETIDDRPKDARRELGVADRKLVNLHTCKQKYLRQLQQAEHKFNALCRKSDHNRSHSSHDNMHMGLQCDMCHMFQPLLTV